MWDGQKDYTEDIIMTWCNDCNDVQTVERKRSSSPPQLPSDRPVILSERHKGCLVRACPSCGHQIKCRQQACFIFFVLNYYMVIGVNDVSMNTLL